MLTAKEQRFREEYLVDLNGAQAAIRAGYAPRSAKVTACRLLRKLSMKAAIEVTRAEQIASDDLSAARVLEELRRCGLSNVQGFFDAQGNLRPLHTLTPEQAACISSVEVIIKNAKAGDNQVDTIYKIKLWDKPRSLEMLAKHFALLVDRVQIDDDAAMVTRLLAGRQRAAEAHARDR